MGEIHIQIFDVKMAPSVASASAVTSSSTVSWTTREKQSTIWYYEGYEQGRNLTCVCTWLTSFCVSWKNNWRIFKGYRDVITQRPAPVLANNSKYIRHYMKARVKSRRLWIIYQEPTEGWRLQTRKEENDPNREAANKAHSYNCISDYVR